MFNGSNSDFTMPVMPAMYGGGNNGGFGGFGDGWWAIIIFAMIFGWGNGGWGGSFGGGGNTAGLQGALTRGDLCQDMSFANLETAVRGVQTGLSDGFYAVNTGMLNGFSDVQQTLCAGFGGITNTMNQNTNAIQQDINAASVAAMQGNFALQQAINADTVANMQNTNTLSTQLAQCCCENRSGQKDIQYSIATQTNALQNSMCLNTRDIIDNQNANSRQILDFLVNDKIADLQQENQTLRLAASQERQNSYLVDRLMPTARPAYITCSPYASAFGYPYGLNGYNNGNCGCGCGCA